MSATVPCPLRPAILLALALVGLLALPALAPADIIIMTSGRIWEGTTETLEDGRLRIILDSGGSFVVEADQVEAVEPERDLPERLRIGNQALRADPPDFETAYRQYRLASREAQNDPDVVYGLARSLQGLGDRDRALAEVQRGVLLNPDHVRLRVLYAELLVLDGQRERGLAVLERAIELAPGDAWVGREAERIREVDRQLQEEHEADPETVPGPERSDSNLGNTTEAADRALELLLWARETDTHQREDDGELFITGRLETVLRSGTESEARAAARNGDAETYRTFVRRAQWRCAVDGTLWANAEVITDRQKRLVFYGWYYQLKRAYPRAEVYLEVGIRERNRRGQEQTRTVARAYWDPSRDRLEVELSLDED